MMGTKKIMHPDNAAVLSTTADINAMADIVMHSAPHFGESEWLTKFWRGIAIGFALHATRNIYEAKTT